MNHYQALLEALQITEDDVTSFRDENVGLCHLEVCRLSQYLLAQLSSFHKHRTLNSFAITDAIQTLEGVGRPTLSAPEKQFDHPPLKGLWKAHFVDASFLPKNLANEVRSRLSKKRKLEELCARIANEEENSSTQCWQARLAHELVFGSYESKVSRKALTGEWLIFGKRGGKNYYLGVAKHSSTPEGDVAIYEQINRLCAHEFPFLFSAMNQPEPAISDPKNSANGNL